MKTDPKIREMTTRPEVALLLHESPTGEEHTSWEMEVTGRAEVVRDADERERAKRATMRTSSIVQYLDSVGQTDLLAFVRVTPRFMKHRVFGEIVAGRPPSILEFADATDRPSDLVLLRRRLGVWRESVRWPSLTASAASVAVGVAASFAATGGVRWGWALLTLIGAGVYSLWKQRGLFVAADIPVFAVGLLFAFASALICIRWLIRYLTTHDFTIFAWYRIAFGGVILLTSYLGWVDWAR
jgi:hypothetical protein